MLVELWYVKCSKFLNTSCLANRQRQTIQTQIRLLLKSSLIKVFPVCYSHYHFVTTSPDNQYFIFNQKKKSVRNFRIFTIYSIYFCSQLMRRLSGLHLRIPMSNKTSWELNKSHIRVACRLMVRFLNTLYTGGFFHLTRFN